MTRGPLTEDAGSRARHTRQRIIKAARELIAESGLESVRIEEIAERAKVGRSTFYLHFGGRAELANAIAVDELILLNDLWVELACFEPDDFDAIRKWFLRVIERWNENRSLTVIAIEYRTDQQQLAADMVDVQFSAAATFVDELRRQGEKPPNTALEEARIGFMVAARFLYLHVSMQVPYGPEAVDAVAEHLRYALLRARGDMNGSGPA